VLVTAPNLDEGACAIVNPLGTVDFRRTDWSGGVSESRTGMSLEPCQHLYQPNPERKRTENWNPTDRLIRLTYMGRRGRASGRALAMRLIQWKSIDNLDRVSITRATECLELTDAGTI
jgi:hypothetical protein